MDHAAKGEFKDKDASEKTWLQDGLALQLKIRETDLAKPHKATHKRRHRRAHQSTDATSLYPEVPIVSEARECAENFGQCSLEELLSVQHRKYFRSRHVCVAALVGRQDWLICWYFSRWRFDTQALKK